MLCGNARIRIGTGSVNDIHTHSHTCTVPCTHVCVCIYIQNITQYTLYTNSVNKDLNMKNDSELQVKQCMLGRTCGIGKL